MKKTSFDLPNYGSYICVRLKEAESGLGNVRLDIKHNNSSDVWMGFEIIIAGEKKEEVRIWAGQKKDISHYFELEEGKLFITVKEGEGGEIERFEDRMGVPEDVKKVFYLEDMIVLLGEVDFVASFVLNEEMMPEKLS